MNDDLISRNAAIDEVKRLHDVAWANWKETRISANTMIDALKDLPSVQPEKIPHKKPEIIYCTECKKCWDSGTATINGQSCRIFKCSAWERPVSPFGFCYMAERRTNDSD